MRKSLFLWLVLIVFSLYLGWLFWLTARPVRTGAAALREPSLLISAVELSEVEGRAKIWQLEAKSARVEENKKLTVLDQAAGTFFQDGQKLIALVSPEVSIDYRRGEITCRRPELVYFERQSGRQWQVRGEEFFWNSQKKTLRGTGQIKAVSRPDQLEIRSGQVEFTGRDFSWRFWPQIQADWRDIKMTGGAGSYLSHDKKLEITGPVRFERTGGRVQGDKLTADLARWRVDLLGDVRLETSDLIVASQRARYDLKDEKIYLEGQPRLASPRLNTAGRTIVYSFKDDKIRVIGQGEVIIKP